MTDIVIQTRPRNRKREKNVKRLENKSFHISAPAGNTTRKFDLSVVNVNVYNEVLGKG
jgi:hypothetical protein